MICVVCGENITGETMYHYAEGFEQGGWTCAECLEEMDGHGTSADRIADMLDLRRIEA